MLTAYRAYSYASCGVLASVVSLLFAGTPCGFILFYAWGLLSILTVLVSIFCKFNKLPACLHAILLVLLPIAALVFPDSASSIFSVAVLMTSCFLLTLYYSCAKSTDGKGDYIMQGLEHLLLNPLSLSFLAVFLVPAGLVLGFIVLVAQSGFIPD